MANKQAFQFWYEKDSRGGGWGGSATTPRLPCPPRKHLSEPPSGCTRTQASGVVATLKLKWEQVPERGRHDTVEASDSRSSRPGNVLDRPKKSSMPTSWSFLDSDHKNRSSASIKSRDSKGTAKKISTDQLLPLAKLSPAPKGACGMSCYGHAPVINQVIYLIYYFNVENPMKTKVVNWVLYPCNPLSIHDTVWYTCMHA